MLLLSLLLLLWVPRPVHALSVPWIQHRIDLSGVNEYIEAHYDIGRPYLEEREAHPIYNAREGIGESQREPSLEDCGFCVNYLPDGSPAVMDWTDTEQVRSIYLPQLRTMLQDTFGADLLHVVFWHPMLRGECMGMSRGDKTAPIASLAHIDTDVGAYNLDDLMSLIDKNRIQESVNVDILDVQRALQRGQRFAIVNAWRNVRDEPVQRAPLALCHPLHIGENVCFPTARPLAKSRWYTFPEMTKNEVLLFKQYDRRLDRASDIWHCALKDVAEPSAVSRMSFDVRAFCVFTSIVPPPLDRYHEDRQRPKLTLLESECFCESQASNRQ